MAPTFIERMTTHWQTRLGMDVSAALIAGWEQLEVACTAAGNGSPAWQVLQLPTGTGKTQALAVLCASQSLLRHPGILIVTRYRAEADKLAEAINGLAQQQVALALHGMAPAETRRIHSSPVLVITHSAYRNALREIASDQGHQTQWDRIRHYLQAERRWLVVDEAFDWIESFQVDVTELSALSGALASLVQPNRSKSLGDLAELTNSIVGVFERDGAAKSLTDRQIDLLQELDIAELKSLVSHSMPSDLDLWQSIEKPRRALQKEYLSTLEQLCMLQRAGNAWVSKRGKRIKVNGSRLLMTADGKHGVILDATAAVDPMYELLGNRVGLIPRPALSRSYSNVTLNLSVGHSVGKEHLSKQAGRFWPDIRSGLNKHLSHECQTLIVCHKDVEAELSIVGLNGNSVSKAHWGDLDGKNDWCDYDVAVIFGLPFLDDIAPTNAVLACQPQLSTAWFNGSRAFGQHRDIGQTFKDGFVAKSVVQALNRIRCRKPIDAVGNCMPTDVFMLQGNGRTGSAVLNAIQFKMHGIRIRGWKVAVSKRPRRIPAHEKLLSHLATAAVGMHLKSSIVASLSINDRTFERMSPTLQETSSPLAQELTSLGVQYHCYTGRGKEAYFIKS